MTFCKIQNCGNSKNGQGLGELAMVEVLNRQEMRSHRERVQSETMKGFISKFLRTAKLEVRYKRMSWNFVIIGITEESEGLSYEVTGFGNWSSGSVVE